MPPAALIVPAVTLAIVVALAWLGVWVGFDGAMAGDIGLIGLAVTVLVLGEMVLQPRRRLERLLARRGKVRLWLALAAPPLRVSARFQPGGTLILGVGGPMPDPLLRLALDRPLEVAAERLPALALTCDGNLAAMVASLDEERARADLAAVRQRSDAVLLGDVLRVLHWLRDHARFARHQDSRQIRPAEIVPLEAGGQPLADPVTWLLEAMALTLGTRLSHADFTVCETVNDLARLAALRLGAMRAEREAAAVLEMA